MTHQPPNSGAPNWQNQPQQNQPQFSQPAPGTTPNWQGQAPTGQPHPGMAAPNTGYAPAPPPAAKKSSGKLWLIAGVAALLMLVGGVATAWFLLKGSSPKAASALPSDSMAVLEANLNPSTADLLALRDFVNRFPSLATDSEETDFKKILWDMIPEDEEKPDYDTEIKPWLGDSFALALTPTQFGDSDPQVVVAVEVTNKGKAEAFSKSESSEDIRFTFVGDIMLISESYDLSTVSEDNNIQSNKNYQEDMKRLGEGYLMTAWYGEELLPALTETADPTASTEGLDIPAAHGAIGIRIESSKAVLKVVGRQTPEVSVAKVSHDFAKSLPGDSLIAFASAYPEKTSDLLWEQLRELENGTGQEVLGPLGLKSAADLKVLLGDELAFSMGLDSNQQPTIGLKVRSDAAKKHQELLNTLLNNFRLQGIEQEIIDDVAYSTFGQPVTKFSNPDKKLGDNPDFAETTGLTEGSQGVLWINLQQVTDLLGNEVPAEFYEDLKQLSALGMSAEILGDGYSEATIQLTLT